MKAILFYEHGSPEVLTLADFPTPEPGPGEVQVHLKAAALNRLDLWVRAGWKGIRLEYPHIPGADGAGEVTALGTRVDRVSVGDRVVINSNLGCRKCQFCIAGMDNRCENWGLVGETRRGTYAEYVVVPSENVTILPEGYDEHAAAAAALVFHTAWHSLVKRGNVRPGESVLIIGASGGVNTAAIQIVKLCGARVYVVGSNSKKLELAESLGADFLIDRSKEENWSKTVYQLTHRQGVDVVFDNVGTTFPLSLRAARRGGRVLTVGNTGGPKVEIDNRYMFAKHLSLIGSTMGTRADFTEVMGLIFEGRLYPVLDKAFPLAEAELAHRRLEAGEQLGKITLSIDE
jgi:NADPH:quinone reductase-like Zn-dependent oxidoreductase